MRTNERVVTPIGAGVVEGAFGITDSGGQTIVTGVVVRMPIDELTKIHLKKGNCLTPHARFSGLWVFQEGELK